MLYGRLHILYPTRIAMCTHGIYNYKELRTSSGICVDDKLNPSNSISEYELPADATQKVETHTMPLNKVKPNAKCHTSSNIRRLRSHSLSRIVKMRSNRSQIMYHHTAFVLAIRNDTREHGVCVCALDATPARSYAENFVYILWHGGACSCIFMLMQRMIRSNAWCLHSIWNRNEWIGWCDAGRCREGICHD